MADEDQLFARFGKACPVGTVLFREGEHGEQMYVLQSGRVRISKRGRDGEKTLAMMGPGEFFGEMAILNNKPRTATAEVLEDAKALVIDGHTFEQMVLSNTEIALRLIKKLARRLDSADALIDILLHRDPKARVILGLAREAELHGERQPDGSIRVPFDFPGFANQVGLGVDEVQGVLTRLARLDIVREADSALEIPELMRLHEFLEFLEKRQKVEDP